MEIELLMESCVISVIFCSCCRLIRHTEKLLEEKEEKLCIKMLQTLKEMMTVDAEYTGKVSLSRQCSYTSMADYDFVFYAFSI